MYGPVPPGVEAPSTAVKTLLPKKNDRPQSNAGPPGEFAGYVPPSVLKATLLPLNRLVASSMLKFTVIGELMLVPWFCADRLSGDVVGQYHSWLGLGQLAILESAKKYPFDPESTNPGIELPL